MLRSFAESALESDGRTVVMFHGIGGPSHTTDRGVHQAFIKYLRGEPNWVAPLSTGGNTSSNSGQRCRAWPESPVQPVLMKTNATIPASPCDGPQRMRNAVSLRGVMLGFTGVVLISAMTPYNDYALNNTCLISNNLPVGLMLFFFAFAVAVNAPLSRWMPRYAFETREIAVALTIMLVGCALPSSGLMRYLPISLVGPWHYSSQSSDTQQALRELDLPDWMFPSFSATEVEERAVDPIVRGFYGRTVPSDRGPSWYPDDVPWSAWMRPALIWGIFISSLYGAVLCFAVIVRRQWIENERLIFPLATVYLALVEAPKPGSAFNGLLSRRSFWCASLAVFVLHSTNALHLYLPRYVPEIPLGFDLTAMLSEPPWFHADYALKIQTIYFSVIGISLLIRTRVTFSLWFFYIAYQASKMAFGNGNLEISGTARSDQLFGGAAAFAVYVLWLGRKHWLLVASSMFSKCDDSHQNEYLSYRLAGWGLVVSCVVMVGWLATAGMSIIGATVLIVILLMVYLVVARIVAETGLLYAWVNVYPTRFWLFLEQSLPFGFRATSKDFFFSAMFHGVFIHDLRESLPVYSTHALKVLDQASGIRQTPRNGRSIIGILALSLLLGYVVSGMSMLHVEYRHESTLDQSSSSPINRWGAEVPRSLIMIPVEQHARERGAPNQPHNRVGHFLFGAGLIGVLSWARTLFVAFPLDPVGFLVAYSYPMSTIWFSCLVGWLARIMLVGWGGPAVYQRSQPLLIGLIVGEAVTSGFWLLVSALLHLAGAQYHPIHLLPI